MMEGEIKMTVCCLHEEGIKTPERNPLPPSQLTPFETTDFSKSHLIKNYG